MKLDDSLVEKTHGRVSVILISHWTWRDLLKKQPSMLIPYTLYFPPYTKYQILDILALDCPSEEDLECYKGFIRLIHDSLVKPCQDLKEFRHLSLLLWPKYLEPVKQGRGMS
jgi:origin recognition complex subunit 5